MTQRSDASELAAPSRLPSLTSLRWFAALLVFGTHIEPLIRGTSFEAAFGRVGAHGGVGVSFFFVLSGFVLAWTYRTNDSKVRFYRRRFARIAPAYWSSILLALVVFAVVESSLTPSRIARSAFSAALLQAWVPDDRVYLGGNPVGWTLSVEAFFYAVFPALIVVLSKWSPKQLLRLIAALVVLGCVVIPLLLRPEDASDGAAAWAIKIFPPTRLLEFVVGIGLALLLKKGARLQHRLVTVGTAALLVTAAIIADGWLPTYFVFVAATLVPFAVLIFVAAQRDHDGGTGVLHSPILVRLGEWSFCFYLVHQLVVRVIVISLDPAPDLAVRLALVVFALALSIGVAGLMFTFVERPLERRLRGVQVSRPESAARL